jgi:hypothetical protein
MRKLWTALAIVLVLSLVWCTIPAFGGWSWASDPVFLVEGQDGEEMVVNVSVGVGFTGTTKRFYAQRIQVTLSVPDGTDARVFYDGDFKARVKSGSVTEGRAEVKVVVGRQWQEEYHLDNVTVTCDGKRTKPQHGDHNQWIFQFDLP